MSAPRALKALGRPIHPKFPVRWSTALMLVAFLVLGQVYLDVRTTPPTAVPISVVSATTTTQRHTTTVPKHTERSTTVPASQPTSTAAPAVTSTTVARAPDSGTATSSTTATTHAAGSTTSAPTTAP